MVYLAARQYYQGSDYRLTPILNCVLLFFHDLLHDPAFLEGAAPERIMNRPTRILYSDGSKEGGTDSKPLFKGIGGVLFEPPFPEAYYHSDCIDPRRKCFDHVAIIELYASSVAIRLFADKLRGTALLLLCENSHAIGCLVRRSSMVQEIDASHQLHPQRDPSYRQDRTDFTSGLSRNPIAFNNAFGQIPYALRESMNLYALRIWSLVTELDIVRWVEYVNTKPR